MARMARLVVPGFPHHVTQRGNRKQQTFFGSEDYRTYLGMLARRLSRAQVDILAYCLMPNHIHCVAVPHRKDSLANLFQFTHQRYASMINTRNGWTGHLWQERFRSFVMDEQHTIAAIRYVELNPVRAGLCEQPWDWAWSSARAHIGERHDSLLTETPILESITEWSTYLTGKSDGPTNDDLRAKTRTGRPGGDTDFLRQLEDLTGRRLQLKKTGPKPRDSGTCPPN